VGEPRKLCSVTGLPKAVAIAALLAMCTALAACGGGKSNGGASNPSSANYDPATTTLKKAGLEVCSESQTQIPQNLASGPGVQNSRSFFVAKACNGQKVTPDIVDVFQFDSKQSVTAGAAAIQTAMPNGSQATYGPLVIVTLGPNHAANLAAIEAALKSSGAKSG